MVNHRGGDLTGAVVPAEAILWHVRPLTGQPRKRGACVPLLQMALEEVVALQVVQHGVLGHQPFLASVPVFAKLEIVRRERVRE